MRHSLPLLTGVASLAHACPGLISVRAEGDPSEDEVVRSLTAFQTEMRGRFEAIENEMNDQARIAAAALLNGPAGEARDVDPEYRKLFASFSRFGRNEAEIEAANRTGDRQTINAAMDQGTGAAGGYLAPVEWDRKVHQAQRVLSPLRRLCNVVVTGAAAWKTVWSDAAWGSGWVGETASRPATATPSLSDLVIPAGEIYANAGITQKLLDDAAFDVEGWAQSSIATEFERQECIAFLSGDGMNKPRGFMLHVQGATHAAAHPAGPIAVLPSGNASGLTVDGLIDFTYSLAAPYRQNASWLMNSKTASMITKMKDADGNLIWRESISAGQPSTLFGRPVELDENMPNPTAGLLPIAFGDWKKGYTINDRIGIRVLRDPYTNKPYVHMYATKRVGGGVSDPNALKVLQIAA